MGRHYYSCAFRAGNIVFSALFVKLQDSMRLKGRLQCDIRTMGSTSAVLLNDEDSKVGKRKDF